MLPCRAREFPAPHRITWGLVQAAVLLAIVCQQAGGAWIDSVQPQNRTISPEECPQKPILTPEYWNANDFDGYLRNYPRGNSLTLPDYVHQISPGFSFECGLGKHCHVPPICQPLKGRDWYVLWATSRWNYYVNSLATALRNSAQLCDRIIPSLLRDLVKDFDPQHTPGVLDEVNLIRAILAPIDAGGTNTNSASDSVQSSDWYTAVSPITSDGFQKLPSRPHTQVSQPDQGAKAPITNTVELHSQKNAVGLPEDPYAAENQTRAQRRKVKRQLSIPSNTPIVTYNSTQPVIFNLEGTITQFETLLAASINHKIHSPVSLDTGIFSSLSGGRFLVEKVDPATLVPRAKDVVLLTTLAGILNYERAVVMVRKSSCHKHRDSWDSPKNQLAFCASDGTLIQIVKLFEQKISLDFYNAHLIKQKYGFSTSFLASEAWRCLQAQSSQWKELSPSVYEFDACTFQLPICDLTDPQYEKMLQDGQNIAQVCSKAAGLDSKSETPQPLVKDKKF